MIAFFMMWRWWLLGGAAALVVGTGLWQRHEIGSLEDKLQAEKTGRLADRAVASEAAASAALTYRAKEQAWAKSHEEIINAAIVKTEAAASAVVAANAASGRLSDRVATLAAASRATACRPTAARPSEAASDPADLLAFMQRRIDEAAGAIGSYADSAHIAGEACEASYETLRR